MNWVRTRDHMFPKSLTPQNPGQSSVHCMSTEDDLSPLIDIVEPTPQVEEGSTSGIHWLGPIWLVPWIIVLSIALLIDFHVSCTVPVQFWAFEQICVNALQLVGLTLVQQYAPPDGGVLNDSRDRKWYLLGFGITRISNLMWTLNFGTGIKFFFVQSSTCSTTFLYRMCWLLMMAHCIIFSLFLLLCCSLCILFLLFLYLRRRFDPTYEGPRPGATDEQLDAMNTCTLSTSDERLEETCLICLETYEPEDVLRILPCGHYAHQTCLDTWLRQQSSCPVCRDVPTDSTNTTETRSLDIV